MTLVRDAPDHEPPTRPAPVSVDIRTTRADSSRAVISVSGDLDADGAALLAQVVDGHLRGGRRFLRLSVGGLRAIDDRALQVVAAMHDRLLGERGTLILTAVREPVESRLRSAVPASPLLILNATAEELAR